jgi:RNA polymerase sigma-70 factor, ECF subfamily
MIKGMQPIHNEQHLIAQAQQGDKTAMTTLYQAYAEPIFRYVSYRVESDTIAEDITSEVFLRVVQHLGRYKDMGLPFGAWLFRIAMTEVAMHYRRKKGKKVEELNESQPSDDTDPFGRIEKEEERAHLRHALHGLSEEYQTLLILRFMQQRPHQEVATILNKSESAIRVMQHRALKALAKALGTDDKARSYLRGES